MTTESAAAYRIENLSFVQIKQRLTADTALIVPIGGLEPLGEHVPMGLANGVTVRLADLLAVRINGLTAPLVSYGSSIPYMAFEGVAGVKPRHLCTALVDMLRCWTFQGARRFVLLDGSIENAEACRDAGQRHERLHPGCTVKPLCWQTVPIVRQELKKLGFADQPGRCEQVLRVLGGFADATDTCSASPTPDQKKAYTTWRRRGRDPEKFRALYPKGSVSVPGGVVVDSETLFDHIVCALAGSLTAKV